MNTTPILRATNIVKKLGGKTILNDVSLDVHKGDVKVVIGPSGAGKSTFLQCLNYLLPPDSGDIWLEGKKVNARDTRELCALRQQVGMIFQDFNLFDHLTAEENVSIALRKVMGCNKAEARNRALTELSRVGLAKRAALYPAQLSGGQKQRVAIARALAMDPKVMLLDEPTSALDPELVGEVLSVIRDLADGGMTMIMATHQMDFARALATDILFMEQGKIIEQGAPDVLLAPGSGTRTSDFCGKLFDLRGTEKSDEPTVSELLTGVARVFGPKWLRSLGNGFTTIFRGVPLVVQLMILYFGLPNLGIYLEPYPASVLGFILCTGAYQSEYVRGALLSIRQGQIKAAYALGFTKLQTILWVVIPQAARRALPGCGNEIIYLIKYSSLAYIITCIELTGEAKVLVSRSFRPTEVYIVAGIYYLVLVSFATWFLQKLERKFAIPGFGKK